MTEKRYAVREIFSTLQGEGRRAGHRSIFIRFTGCNLWNGRVEDRAKGAGACARWCDTDFARGERFTAMTILDEAYRQWFAGGDVSVHGERWLVITGGEPLLQLDEAFIERAHVMGWKLAVESNGTIFAPSGIDWLTVSPKRGLIGLAQRQAHELKVVLPGDFDGRGWTDGDLALLERQGEWGELYVQPQDVISPGMLGASYLVKRVIGGEQEFRNNLNRCIDFVRRHPRWKLSFQTHKVTGLP